MIWQAMLRSREIVILSFLIIPGGSTRIYEWMLITDSSEIGRGTNECGKIQGNESR